MNRILALRPAVESRDRGLTARRPAAEGTGATRRFARSSAKPSKRSSPAATPWSSCPRAAASRCASSCRRWWNRARGQGQGQETASSLARHLAAHRVDEGPGRRPGRAGRAAACLHSGQTAAERQPALAMVREGVCRLLYVAPERARRRRRATTSRAGRRDGVRYVAIDEAHCISQWGHDFRPEYRQLGALRVRFGVSIHAFTATATPRVRADIVSELGLRDRRCWSARSIGRTSRIECGRARSCKQQIHDVLARHRERGGHHLLPVAPRGRRRWPRGCRARASARFPITRASPTRCATRTRTRSSNEDVDVDGGDGGLRHGHRSARRAVRRCTPARRDRSSTTSRKRDARDATACPPNACSSPHRPTSRGGAACSRRNGERSEQVRLLMRDMERYAAATSCRHRALVEYFGAAAATHAVRRVRLVPRRAGAHRRAGRRSRRRSCRRRAHRPALGRRRTSSPSCAARRARRWPRAGTRS